VCRPAGGVTAYAGAAAATAATAANKTRQFPAFGLVPLHQFARHDIEGAGIHPLQQGRTLARLILQL
jgi:hypothetical protein